VNRRTRVHPFVALQLDRDVDHHDAVFLDDTDQQNDADDGYDPEVLPEEHECQGSGALS